MSVCIFRAARQFQVNSLVLALAMATTTAAQAEIIVGDDTADPTEAPRTELMLLIWDPVAKVSYSKDLGIKSYTTNLSAGNPAENLFVYGQQNSGYQKLFDALNDDSNFSKFLQVSTDINNQYWAVLGGATGEIGAAGDLSVFTTLRHETATNTINPHYATLINTIGETFRVDFGTVVTLVNGLNSGVGGANREFNSHDNVANGSSVNTDLEPEQYLGTYLPGFQFGNLTPDLFNKVNSSSWFYFATTTSDNGNLKIAVDEFDNGTVAGGGHDAYWGLGVDSNGKYILSYTLEASLTQAQTAQGQMLRLRTDFTANYGGTRFIGAPVGDTLDLGGGAITPVPEPSTWGLMGLGLALLAGRARRQKNA